MEARFHVCVVVATLINRGVLDNSWSKIQSLLVIQSHYRLAFF